MKTIKTPFVLTIITAIALAVVVTGCDNKPASETPANELSNAKDAAKDAANKTGEAVKEGAQATKDAVTNAVNAVTNK